MGQVQLSEIKRKGLVATSRRLVFQLIKTLIFVTLLYAGMLYYSDPTRPLFENMSIAVQDISELIMLIGTKLVGGVAMVCNYPTGAVPMASLEQCLAEAGAGGSDIRLCLSALVRSD